MMTKRNHRWFRVKCWLLNEKINGREQEVYIRVVLYDTLEGLHAAAQKIWEEDEIEEQGIAFAVAWPGRELNKRYEIRLCPESLDISSITHEVTHIAFKMINDIKLKPNSRASALLNKHEHQFVYLVGTFSGNIVEALTERGYEIKLE